MKHLCAKTLGVAVVLVMTATLSAFGHVRNGIGLTYTLGETIRWLYFGDLL